MDDTQTQTTSPEVQSSTDTQAVPTPESVAEKLEKAVDEAIAETPVAKSPWAVTIEWMENAAAEEVEAAIEHIKPFIHEATHSPADHLPAAIKAVTIKRA